MTEALRDPFGTFGTLSVSVFGSVHAVLLEHRDACPGVVPVLVCHDEVVIECGSEKAAYAKAWLENAMIEGMDTIVNGTDEGHVPVEVEARIARSWGEGPSGSSPRDIF